MKEAIVAFVIAMITYTVLALLGFSILITVIGAVVVSYLLTDVVTGKWSEEE